MFTIITVIYLCISITLVAMSFFNSPGPEAWKTLSILLAIGYPIICIPIAVIIHIAILANRAFESAVIILEKKSRE